MPSYGSPSAAVVPVIPDLTGHTGALSDTDDGVIDLTTEKNTLGAKRIHLQIPPSDIAGDAFETNLQVLVNYNVGAAPAPGTAGPHYILTPGVILSLDLYPHSTVQNIGYYVNRPGTPTGDLEWGKSLGLTVLY